MQRKEAQRCLASLLGDRTLGGAFGGGFSACAEHCSSWWIRPPLPAPGLPQSLAPSVGLPFVFPVAMAAAAAGILRGGLLPQAGKEWPRSSLRVAAGAH